MIWENQEISVEDRMIGMEGIEVTDMTHATKIPGENTEMIAEVIVLSKIDHTRNKDMEGNTITHSKIHLEDLILKEVSLVYLLIRCRINENISYNILLCI